MSIKFTIFTIVTVVVAWFSRAIAHHFTQQQTACQTLKTIEKQQALYVSEHLCLKPSERGKAGKYAKCDEAVAASVIDVDGACFAEASWKTLDNYWTSIIILLEPQSWRSALVRGFVCIVGAASCGMYFGIQRRMRDLIWIRKNAVSDAMRQREQFAISFDNRLALPEIDSDDEY